MLTSKLGHFHAIFLSDSSGYLAKYRRFMPLFSRDYLFLQLVNIRFSLANYGHRLYLRRFHCSSFLVQVWRQWIWCFLSSLKNMTWSFISNWFSKRNALWRMMPTLVLIESFSLPWLFSQLLCGISSLTKVDDWIAKLSYFLVLSKYLWSHDEPIRFHFFHVLNATKFCVVTCNLNEYCGLINVLARICLRIK